MPEIVDANEWTDKEKTNFFDVVSHLDPNGGELNIGAWLGPFLFRLQ